MKTRTMRENLQIKSEFSKRKIVKRATTMITSDTFHDIITAPTHAFIINILPLSLFFNHFRVYTNNNAKSGLCLNMRIFAYLHVKIVHNNACI